VNIIVDTSIWSLALRRGAPRDTVEERELAELVREGRVLMLGPVRQEILSGIRAEDQSRTLRDRLRAFPDVALATKDYEDAATCFNRCRAKGLQGSNTDFLLCAVALRLNAAILTTDKDFEGFARVLQLKLHRPRAGLSA
jgi:predicted nucleic acid-binding protein